VSPAAEKRHRSLQLREARRRIKIAVEKVVEKWHYNICGYEVTVTKVGGGADMQKIS